MADDCVLIEVSERIATITLNRPEARNALSSEVLRLLPELMRQAEADADVDVLILTGTDPAFSRRARPEGTRHRRRGNLGGGSGADGSRNSDGVRGPFPKLTKPLIGAINGVAITGGFELALNCDFLVASEHAKFGDTHSRVGVMPGWGLTVLLPQAIGDPPGPRDELHRQLHARRRGARLRARQPRRAARRADPDHPPARARHHRQRPGRRAPDPLDTTSRSRPTTTTGRSRPATAGPGAAPCSAPSRSPPAATPSKPAANSSSSPSFHVCDAIRSAGLAILDANVDRRIGDQIWGASIASRAEFVADGLGDVEGEDLGAVRC